MNMNLTKISLCFFIFFTLVMSGFAKQVELDAALSNSYLLAGSRQTLYLKVGLRGFELEASSDRTPINVAIVLDKSGSMEGEKIAQAKEAAILAVEMLNKQDIVSVVLYDDVVSVLIPATKVSDKQNIIRAIKQIEAGGSTALFAGVSKGAAEVRKFLDKNKVNRVILLSDGLANVGPDSPGAFADLGASLMKEGIAVTTIGLGLGYNEDLMVTLAQKSDGNHAFVEESADLVRIFNYEFGDVLSVVAQEVVVEIRCADGIRPVKVLGRDADISGQMVYVNINQLYSKQEKCVLLELEVPAGVEDASRKVATVSVAYANMQTQTTDKLGSSLEVRFTDSAKVIEENQADDVMVAVLLQVATLTNAKALELRDQGQVDEAQILLEENAAVLRAGAAAYDSDELFSYGEENEEDAMNLDDSVWNERRKSMKKEQYGNQIQQSY